MRQQEDKKELYVLHYQVQKKRHPFFSEAITVGSSECFRGGGTVTPAFCLTSDGFPASLSPRTNPALPTEILPRRNKGAVTFAYMIVQSRHGRT